MQFDRKLLLIAPTIVLVFVAAGTLYAAVQLRQLVAGGDTWKARSEFLTSVERGTQTLNQRQAVGLLRLSLDVETRRTAAIDAAYDLLLALAAMSAVCLAVLAFGVSRVPREHWPTFQGTFRRR
jgi:hypothetical protein